MPSQKPNIIENLRAKHEPHQKLAARVLGLEKRVSKLDGTKALPPGKDTKALPPVAKKTKIGASSFKKGTALDPGYAARVQGKDATGEYISAEERKAQFKKTKITGADIKRTGAVGSAENAAEVDANQKAAIDKAKIDLATKYEGSPADSIKPPDAEAEKGGALAKPTETLIGPLKTIDNGVNNIVETLKKSNKVDADAQADARKQAEKDKRKKAEGKLEGVKGALSKAADTVLKPVKNIFQQIWDFLKIVFFGRIAMKLFEWFTNPENTKKVSAIFRFLKDWWPVLVAGIMAIVGPGIIFTVGLIALLAWGIPKIVNIVKTLFGFGPKVDKELKNVEQDADALGQDSKKEVEAQGLEPKEETEDKPPETDQTSAQVGESEKQAEDLKSGADKSEMPPETVKMAQGGEVPGTGSGDTVPAMLTPGEFVMSKGAVQQYGANTLAGMNAAAGGTNRPTVGRYEGGGFVQNVSQSLNVPSFTYPKSSSNIISRPTLNFAGGGLVADGYDKSPKEAAASVESGDKKKSPLGKAANLGKRLLKFLTPFGGIPFVGKKIVAMGGELVGGVEELIVGYHDQMHSQSAAQVAKGKPVLEPVNPPSRPGSPDTPQDPVAKVNAQSAIQTAPNQELPNFSASSMRSGSKIKTLGIMV